MNTAQEMAAKNAIQNELPFTLLFRGNDYEGPCGETGNGYIAMKDSLGEYPLCSFKIDPADRSHYYKTGNWGTLPRRVMEQLAYDAKQVVAGRSGAHFSNESANRYEPVNHGVELIWG